jgi:hypothetical protein
VNEQNSLLRPVSIFLTITLVNFFEKGKEGMSTARKPAPQQRKNRTRQNRLPFLLVIGGMLILIGALFFAFRKPAAPFVPAVIGKPSLQVDKEKIDLGNRKLGNTVFASFEVKNVGDQVLRITRAPTIQVIEGC